MLIELSGQQAASQQIVRPLSNFHKMVSSVSHEGLLPPFAQPGRIGHSDAGAFRSLSDRHHSSACGWPGASLQRVCVGSIESNALSSLRCLARGGPDLDPDRRNEVHDLTAPGRVGQAVSRAAEVDSQGVTEQSAQLVRSSPNFR